MYAVGLFMIEKTDFFFTEQNKNFVRLTVSGEALNQKQKPPPP